MLSKVIRNFIAKRVAGRTDDGIMITLSDPKKVDFQAAMLEDLLMRNGINPKLIQTENQLKNILNQIKAAEAQATATSGIRGSQSAKVFDLEGKEIPQGSQIMGGKATETEAEIAARLREQNKDSVSRILDRKNREDVYGLEDYDTTNMSDLQKEIIRTEAKLGNLNPDSPNFRERAKPLIDKIEALKNKMKSGKTSSSTLDQQIKNEYDKAVKEGKFKNIRLKDGRRIKSEDDFREYIDELNEDNDFDFATGGRVGLKAGMSRRAFLKLMGSVGAGVGAAKTGLLKILGKGASTPVVEKTAEAAGSAPPYFFKLVDKIKKMGDDVTEISATKEREVVTEYKDYRLTEDLATGEKTIQRIKLDSDFDFYDETLAEDVYMNYKPGKGQTDEATRKVADEYTEDTSYLRTSGPQKGEVYDTVEGIPDDVLEEIGEKKVISEKASGGIARMLGE